MNLLIGLGDAYSTDAAHAFEAAAIDNGIDVCTKAEYEAGSLDMKTPIKQIIDNRCCLVTVLFGQSQDISSLLFEGRRQNYDGEWLIPDTANAYIDAITTNLRRKHLDEPSIHKLLRGMLEYKFKNCCSCSYIQRIDLIAMPFYAVFYNHVRVLLMYTQRMTSTQNPKPDNVFHHLRYIYVATQESEERQIP